MGMQWKDVTQEHHGMKVEVWALSTPDQPRTKSSVKGTIVCPAEGVVPWLRETDTRAHSFAGWWNVTLL